MNNSIKIIVTGGGTGGHVFPALSICEELRDRGFLVIYVGTKSGLESKLVPQKGFKFFTVRTGAIKNKGLLTIIRTAFLLGLGILSSLSLLFKEKPSAVIGVGGYVSVPIVLSSFILRIPIFLQEQNASVGIANRFLGRLAKKIFLGFEDAKKSFSASKCIYSGNPIRHQFFNNKIIPYNPRSGRLLIVGGSQGAKAINDLILEFLIQMKNLCPQISIVHQTGSMDFERIKHQYEKRPFLNCAQVIPFIDNIFEAYGNASLVIARSGALTVSELCQVERPAIFIPYPRMGQNDQTANAYLMEKNGTARVVEQNGNFREKFWCVFQEVFQPSKLELMKANFSRLHKINALATIVDHIQKELQKNSGSGS